MKVTRYSIIRRYAYRGNPTWYGGIGEPGRKTRYFSLATRSKAQAEAWLKAAMQGRFEDTPGKAVSVHSAALKFLEGVEGTHGGKSATLKAYDYRIRIWTGWCDANGVQDLHEFGVQQAQDYSLHLSSKYGSKTHREALRVLRQFCSWAKTAYRMEDWAPMDLVQPPKLKRRAKAFWTTEQVDAILDSAPDPQTRLFWSLMAFAGLRHSEAVQVGPSSFVEGRIRVVGKGDKESFVPVSDRLSSEMARCGDYSWSLELTNNYRANKALHGVTRALGIPDGGLHQFRHSFASNLIRSGANIKAVQQLMRHENVQLTLDTYSHLLQEDLKETADLL